MSLLPKNERRDVKQFNKKKLWIYSPPFAGKSTLADKFPDPLFLSTDGNVNNITAPYLLIKNTVTVEGRLTKTTLAWETLKNVLAELEKKENDFKTIVIDLVEDTYEHCRAWCYKQMGIEHESDNSFKAWDYVRKEYLDTMKRFMNLDYENIILISHEDASKDITKKSGDKITSIRPNITDKIALKLAGMVDIVARIVVDEGKRTISFKSDHVIFGGGRLKLNTTEIPLDYDALMSIYENSVEQPTTSVVRQPKQTEKPTTPVVEDIEEPTEELIEEPTTDVVEDERKSHRRRINLDQ